MKIIGRLLLLVFVIALVAIQFIPVDTDNPPIVREVEWDSPETRQLAQWACFDCHSNETRWPWYARIAPLSFRIAHHVEEGRQHLNFSNWQQPNEDLEEIVEVIEDGEMPLRSYRLMHPMARLSEDEKAQLISGLEATFASDPPMERRRRNGAESSGED